VGLRTGLDTESRGKILCFCYRLKCGRSGSLALYSGGPVFKYLSVYHLEVYHGLPQSLQVNALIAC
jgi:hypothetical protein